MKFEWRRVVFAVLALASARCGSGDSVAGIKLASDDGGAPACTGKAGAQRGKTNRSVMAAGVNRTYVAYEPDTLDPNKPTPLVFVYHGAGMSGQAMFDTTQYAAVADREGLVVAFPDGETGPGSIAPWNIGTGVCGVGAFAAASGDDFAFLDAMIAEIETDQCLDHRHTFVTGFSMGGYFTHHTGCMRPDIAAVAPHSGATHPFTDCASGPKPVIIFHGTADPLIAPSCDDTARRQWVEHNGCGADVDSKPVKGGHCEWSQGCPSNAQVTYCLFDGMAHIWAGGSGTSGDPNYESATELSWNFFKNYAW